MSDPRQHSGQSIHLRLYKRAITVSELKQASAKPPSIQDERNLAIASQHPNTGTNVSTNHTAHQTKDHTKSPPTINPIHPPPTLPLPPTMGRLRLLRDLQRSPHLQEPPTRRNNPATPTLTRSPCVAQYRHPAYARLQIRPQPRADAGS